MGKVVATFLLFGLCSFTLSGQLPRASRAGGRHMPVAPKALRRVQVRELPSVPVSHLRGYPQHLCSSAPTGG